MVFNCFFFLLASISSINEEKTNNEIMHTFNVHNAGKLLNDFQMLMLLPMF